MLVSPWQLGAPGAAHQQVVFDQVQVQHEVAVAVGSIGGLVVSEPQIRPFVPHDAQPLLALSPTPRLRILSWDLLCWWLLLWLCGWFFRLCMLRWWLRLWCLH